MKMMYEEYEDVKKTYATILKVFGIYFGEFDSQELNKNPLIVLSKIEDSANDIINGKGGNLIKSYVNKLMSHVKPIKRKKIDIGLVHLLSIVSLGKQARNFLSNGKLYSAIESIDKISSTLSIILMGNEEAYRRYVSKQNKLLQSITFLVEEEGLYRLLFDKVYGSLENYVRFFVLMYYLYKSLSDIIKRHAQIIGDMKAEMLEIIYKVFWEGQPISKLNGLIKKHKDIKDYVINLKNFLENLGEKRVADIYEKLQILFMKNLKEASDLYYGRIASLLRSFREYYEEVKSYIQKVNTLKGVIDGTITDVKIDNYRQIILSLGGMLKKINGKTAIEGIDVTTLESIAETLTDGLNGISSVVRDLFRASIGTPKILKYTIFSIPERINIGDVHHNMFRDEDDVVEVLRSLNDYAKG